MHFLTQKFFYIEIFFAIFWKKRSDDTELDEESFGSLEKGESVKKNSYRLRDCK